MQPEKSVINMPKCDGGTSGGLPSHQSTVTGVLPNGFSYIILPNNSPEGRFESHLQVFTGAYACICINSSISIINTFADSLFRSGSSSELHHQQGLAHLTEHVAYMGSVKREKLFGTGGSPAVYIYTSDIE